MEVLRGDSVLWLRFLLLYAVAQAAADAGDLSQGKALKEESQAEAAVFFQRGAGAEETPLLERGERRESAEGLPLGLTDPVEVAKWALQVAAGRLRAKDGASSDPRSQPLDCRTKFTVFFGWQQLSDPRSFMPAQLEPPGGWATWWSFKEWDWYSRVYGIYKACLDQGKFDHVRPKPTTFATTSWKLYEQLDQQFLCQSERASFGRGPTSPQQRIREVASWASWAPGLARLVAASWKLWKVEHGLWEEARARQVLLGKLTEQEAIKRHEANDHSPYWKGCPVCVASRGDNGVTGGQPLLVFIPFPWI